MECDICQRAHHPKRLPFLCAVDARNALYEGRIAHARLLMEMEGIESRVNKLLLDSDAGPGSSAPKRPTRAYVDNCTSEHQKAKDRTEKIIASADRLRDEVAASRREIEERRAAIARKKSDLASVTQGVAARRNREVEETRRVIKMTRYTWDREYEAMASYRAALCMEVAKLYRLQRVRRGNPIRFEYKIGGIDIIDLQYLNNAQPELISASLAHIAHLLWLTSHYLAVRLPAELTLPHNDYPRPTILSLASSYNHAEIPFPGSANASDPRDRQFASIPYPRPLFVDKPLLTLQKEDSLAYNTFLEGVCLLAYDIVWLCRTQGVPVGTDGGSSFDDMASLGRNLYNLLINSSLQRNPQQIADGTGRHHQHASDGGLDLGRAAPRMGLYSHGTAHTFLAGREGGELTRSIRLPNPVKLADRLKQRLGDDADSANPVPEWELLEDDAWAPEESVSTKAHDEYADDGVLVGGTRPKHKAGARFGAGHESYMSVATVRGGAATETPRSAAAAESAPRKAEKEREKSSNGWTKIKPR
ncbi:hypothetical protein F4780DRAFT_763320 [Xylariomycetidae sp. FL0641]|nr:hypothetical protein F4780DRAFT_763320 [Xylariomycetidae sp. FL0641]